MSTEGNAGSLEPVNAGQGKWWEDLDAADIEHLKGLATDIDKAVDTTVKQVARGKIKVGKLLLEARKCFQNDDDFGKWRVMHTMVQSKQHAHYLMQVADRFGDAPKLIEGANYSVLQELVLADQKEIEWVEGEIEKGTPPTVAEVRKKVGRVKGMATKARPGARHTPVSPKQDLNELVQRPVNDRVKQVVESGIKGIEGHLIILGLDPDPQCPCNPEVLEAIEEYWTDPGTETTEQYGIIMRSIQAVTEEFKNWDK